MRPRATNVEVEISELDKCGSRDLVTKHAPHASQRDQCGSQDLAPPKLKQPEREINHAAVVPPSATKLKKYLILNKNNF